jgi:type IV secretory pathway VirB10-like protein
MMINKAAVGLLVGVGIAAGAGGAYIATKASAPAAETAQLSNALASTATGPVEQSEAIVNDPPSAAPTGASPLTPVARVASSPARDSAPKAPAPVERRRNERARANEPVAPVASPAPEPPKASPAPAPIEVVEPPRIADNQASRAVEPVGPIYDELVVSADSVIGLEIETAITTERARVEDAVVARVTRDVKVGNRVAIPAGSRANGEVTTVERGGRLKERARLGVRFTSIVLADGTRVPIDTETIYREGDSPTNESAAKIGGGAIGGAIIGGILGGGKGAAIGSIVGAGAGTGVVAAGGRNAATLPSGTPVTVRVKEPVAVTVER